MAKQKQRSGAISKSADGRVKAFEPTQEQRRLVQQLAGIGCTEGELRETIDWHRPDGLPISLPTLRRHFRNELNKGRALAHMKVKKSLFEQIQAGSVASTIFYLKTQCGWKETVAVENSGPNGAPLSSAPVFYLPVKDQPAGDAVLRMPPALADRTDTRQALPRTTSPSR